MSGQSLLHFLHAEMDKTYREVDQYRCQGTILAKWDGLHFSDRSFNSENFFDALNECCGQEDRFFSINSFYCGKRTTDNIRHLNAFVIDYDYYKIPEYSHLSAAEMFEIIRPTLLIEPTAVIDSGRGLYCLFAIQHCSHHMTDLYRQVYKNLLFGQEQFGADPRATLVTQVIRVPGSINSRSGRTVQILTENDTRYSLPDLANKLLPYSKEEAALYNEQKAAKQSKNSSQHKAKSVFGLEQDLKKLIVLRNQEGKLQGYREQLLYLYWEALLWHDISDKSIQNRVLAMNRYFFQPLDESTVLKQCRPAQKYQYRSSYKTIIRKLEISEDEMKHLKVLVPRQLYKRRSEKAKRRTLQGKTKKADALKRRREKVLEMIGVLKISEIAGLLSVSKKTILRDLAYISAHLAEFQRILQRLWKMSFAATHEFIQEVVNRSAYGSWHGVPELMVIEGRWCFM